jgi:predicted MFS family arabinose efflux permease
MITDFIKSHNYRLWVLSAGWFSSSVGFSISIPFISIYFHSELGIAPSTIGIFFGLAAIIRSISHSFGGELSDHIGRYRIMITAQFLRVLTFFLISYAVYAHWGFYALGTTLIINFILGSFFQPAANATVADLVPPEKRTEGYAIIRSVENLGWAAGPAIGGFLAASSYSSLFIISAAMTFVSATIISIFLKGIKNASENNRSSSFREMFTIKGNELIFRHVILVFILYLAVAQMIAPFSLFAVDFKGISKQQLGFLFTLNGLLVTTLQIPITKMVRGLKLTTQLGAGALFYAAGYFLMGLSSAYAFFIVAFIIITLGENLVSPPSLTMAANLAPEGRVGRYMGIYGFAVSGGWSLGPLLGGVLIDGTKPDFIYMWGTISLLALVAAFGFRRLARHIPAATNIYRN